MFEKYKFKRAYRKKKSYLVSYPLIRCIGKTTLIYKLARKRRTDIITKYWFANRGKPGYIKETNIIKGYGIYSNDRLFFVDGISKGHAENLIRQGYILIGYID